MAIESNESKQTVLVQRRYDNNKVCLYSHIEEQRNAHKIIGGNRLMQYVASKNTNFHYLINAW